MHNSTTATAITPHRHRHKQPRVLATAHQAHVTRGRHNTNRDRQARRAAAGTWAPDQLLAARNTMEGLVLDAAVRNWVFIPLTVFIVLMKLTMQYVHNMTMASSPSTKEVAEIKEQQAVTRSQRIRAAAGWLPETGFRMRREFFVEKTHGLFNQPPKTRAMHETMATDPNMMADMMKKNLTGMVPQVVMGTAVSFFFSGFVMGKIPFGLSPRFRPMLQRGVDLASLDVSYLTSLSYYFALLFACRGPFSLVFREHTVDETEMMRRQMNPMAAAGAGFDAAGMFKAEAAAYGALEHEWALAGVEQAALELLQKQLRR